jgi:hypothetical protein
MTHLCIAITCPRICTVIAPLQYIYYNYLYPATCDPSGLYNNAFLSLSCGCSLVSGGWPCAVLCDCSSLLAREAQGLPTGAAALTGPTTVTCGGLHLLPLTYCCLHVPCLCVCRPWDIPTTFCESWQASVHAHCFCNLLQDLFTY